MRKTNAPPIEIDDEAIEIIAGPIEIGDEAIEIIAGPIEIGDEAIEIIADPIEIDAGATEIESGLIETDAEPIEIDAGPIEEIPSPTQPEAKGGRSKDEPRYIVDDEQGPDSQAGTRRRSMTGSRDWLLSADELWHLGDALLAGRIL